MTLSPFTAQQQILRKKWLFLTFIIQVISPILSSISDAAYLLRNQQGDMESVILHIILIAIFSALFFYISYRCAYKKPGTRFLTLWIYLTPLSAISNLVHFMLSTNPASLWSTLIFLLYLGLVAWWYKLTLNFRKLNDILRAVSSIAQ